MAKTKQTARKAPPGVLLQMEVARFPAVNNSGSDDSNKSRKIKRYYQ